MKLFDDLSKFLQLPKHTFLASHPNAAARYNNLQTNLASLPTQPEKKFSFLQLNYDSLAANSRAKVGKILLQQKQYEFLNYLLYHYYPHVGWENEAALLKAELIYETIQDSSQVAPSVATALLGVKNPEEHSNYFRILGMAYFKDGVWHQAKEHLEKYLALNKTAKGRLYIQGIINRCEQNEQ